MGASYMACTSCCSAAHYNKARRKKQPHQQQQQALRRQLCQIDNKRGHWPLFGVVAQKMFQGGASSGAGHQLLPQLHGPSSTDCVWCLSATSTGYRCCWCCCAAVGSCCSWPRQRPPWQQSDCAHTLQHRWGRRQLLVG